MSSPVSKEAPSWYPGCLYYDAEGELCYLPESDSLVNRQDVDPKVDEATIDLQEFADDLTRVGNEVPVPIYSEPRRLPIGMHVSPVILSGIPPQHKMDHGLRRLCGFHKLMAALGLRREEYAALPMKKSPRVALRLQSEALRAYVVTCLGSMDVFLTTAGDFLAAPFQLEPASEVRVWAEQVTNPHKRASQWNNGLLWMEDQTPRA